MTETARSPVHSAVPSSSLLVRETQGAVLGWHDSHCASAVLLAPDGRILYAAAEERFLRKKLYKGHPANAIADIRARLAGRAVAVAYQDLPIDRKIIRNFGLAWHSWRRGLNSIKSIPYLTGIAGRRIIGEREPAQDSIPRADTLCEHHIAHAMSAYYCSGFDRAYVVTVDGVGDCLSGTISLANGGALARLKSFYYNELHVGADYETFTAMLGFNPDWHCGKITGLAAFGRHNEACIGALRRFFEGIWQAGHRNYFDRMHGAQSAVVLSELRELGSTRFGSFTREDLAYAMQYLAEQRVLNLIRENIRDIQKSDVALAGGVFANVRINQKVKELGFRNIFIQPAMDDGGLSLGVALYHLSRRGPLKPYRLPNVFCGPSYAEDEIVEALDRAGIVYEKTDNLGYAVARLIADGKVVARFDGAMEFGPRALGNRSILYDTRDPKVNDWLNRRLKRTEFMPFAPATLADRAHECYLNLDGCRHAAEFMTITFDCTDYMKRTSPAVVHVDGTARAQLVTPEANPGFYEVLDEYRKLTGIPSLLNTSFNMHEAPIVMTPPDAIESFQEGKLDTLAIGPYLVHREANA